MKMKVVSATIDALYTDLHLRDQMDQARADLNAVSK
jgi:hypothetical protein